MRTQNRKTYIDHIVLFLIMAINVAGNGIHACAQNPQPVSLDPDFSRDIRPILSNLCFSCHGPDEQSREADLRLDTEEGLFQIRDDHAIVKRGDTNGSELVTRILSSDPDMQMPPPGSKKNLSDEQRQLLVRWVKSGATWNQHWAFVTPSKPVPPQADAPQVAGWPENEIDQFLLQAQQQHGLVPSPQADVYTLIRRLFLDLIGLPPTVTEADDWAARLMSETTGDDSVYSTVIDDTAWHALVEDLLARPTYGERWARHWLDLARYADTNGYEKDRDRSIWPYRDWVIDALNADMPFDQFTIEQLAGDMLPNATPSQRIATGFHRNTMLNEEGGIDPLEFRFHAMTDRVATTGTTWLGLTTGCAQCHTHKYDPITHRDYYQLMAFLNNADEPSLELPDKDFEHRWQVNQAQADELQRTLPEKWPVEQDREKSIAAAFSEWLKSERRNAVTWQFLKPAEAHASLPTLTIQADDSIFASGDTAKRDDYFVTFNAIDEPITSLRLEALPDERLPARGPGTTYYEGTLGDFYLTELHAKTSTAEFPFASATETYAKNRFGNSPATAAMAIDGDVQTGWAVHERQGERHVAVFVLKEPIPASVPLSVQMSFGRHFASSLGRFRFSATSAPHATQARNYADDVGRLLLAMGENQTSDSDALWQQFLLSAPELATEVEAIRKLRLRPAVAETLVMQERPVDHPRPTFRHHRGEYLQPREAVTPATPEILHSWPAELPKNRLGFAKWLMSPKNPLTSRVIVNRHWAAFFGRGIVATPDDFGMQGSPPAHPALLDWLAVTLMIDDRWSLKQLHRRIVTSAAYRQASVHRADSVAIDPENRLLTFMPRIRLEAEIVRDSLLQASGVLSKKRGGTPVRPPQPAGITEVAFGSPKWSVSEGEDRYRRSIYTLIKRTAPFAMITTFDGLSGEQCVAQRSRSNTPLQALTLLNDNMFVDMAQAAGKHLLERAELTSDDARIIRLFRQLLTRPPDQDELNWLSEFVAEQRNAFQENPDAARQLMTSDYDHNESKERIVERAVWTATARAVFGLDEAVTRP
ncbi:MAG: PSD1 and planctomycete cytochrome C domain-containing protein [Planctomycetaceae bacterium]